MLKKPQLTNMGFKEGFLKATCEVMAVGGVHAILLIGWWRGTRMVLRESQSSAFRLSGSGVHAGSRHPPYQWRSWFPRTAQRGASVGYMYPFSWK